MSHSFQIRLACAILALGTCAGSATSQRMAHPSTMMVLRQQWGSVADEIVDRLQLAPNTAVWLSLQPTPDSGVAQNAFLEVLLHRGYPASLKSRGDSAEVKLAISALTDRALFKETGQTSYERNVQLDVEARTERNNGQTVAVLGVFHRAVTDTVFVKDNDNPMSRREDVRDEESTLFQRFVGPFIALASGIMIVYLFFTVRS